MAKAEEQRFLVISASSGESFLRLEGEPLSTVEEAVAFRDKRRKASQLARTMMSAARPTQKPAPPRWYSIVAAISDSVDVTDDEANEAAARAHALQGIRSQPGGPPPVALSHISDGVSGPYQPPEE